MPDTGRRPPRWDPDERGIGVGDARAHRDVIDALRRAAVEPGWVAEDPEKHLGPHVTGTLAGEGPFASHGHTLRLSIRDPREAGRGADPND